VYKTVVLVSRVFSVVRTIASCGGLFFGVFCNYGKDSRQRWLWDTGGENLSPSNTLDTLKLTGANPYREMAMFESRPFIWYTKIDQSFFRKKFIGKEYKSSFHCTEPIAD